MVAARRSERRSLVVATALAVLHQLCEVAVPVMVGVVVDRAIAPGDVRALAWSITGLAALFGLRAAAGCLQWPFRTRAVLGTAQAVRMRVVGHELTPGGSSGSAGAQLSLASSDADAVGDTATGLVFLVSGLAAFLVGTVLLVATSPTVGLAVVVVLPVALALGRLAAVPVERRTAVQQQRVAAATELVTDLCRGLRVLRGIDAGATASSRYRAESGHARRAAERSLRALGSLEGLSEAAVGIMAVAVLWIGGRGVVAGDLSVGEFVAAVGLVTYLTGQTYRFTEAMAHNAAGRASAGRVADLLRSAPAAAAGRRPLPQFAAGVEVELRDVCSGPLRGLDLRVGAAETVGVVCTSVAEADALIGVLACRAAPERGRFLVAGRDVRDLDVESVRRTVLVEPRDCVLLGATLAAAVRATARGDVDAALRASGADEVVDALPGGAQAPIGERGSALSGGQRQRVALARALAADRPALVLGDPTTAVDAVTEARIAAALPVARAGRATILITSSPALLAAADRVVLVHRGRAVAAGGHAGLLADEAIYRAAVLR